MKIFFAILSSLSISLSAFAGSSAESISGVVDKIDADTYMHIKIEVKNDKSVEITQIKAGPSEVYRIPSITVITSSDIESAKQLSDSKGNTYKAILLSRHFSEKYAVLFKENKILDESIQRLNIARVSNDGQIVKKVLEVQSLGIRFGRKQIIVPGE